MSSNRATSILFSFCRQYSQENCTAYKEDFCQQGKLKVFIFYSILWVWAVQITYYRLTPKMGIVIDSKTSICYRYFSFRLSGSISPIILPDKKPEYIVEVKSNFKLKEIKSMSLIEYMYDINNISNIETTIYEEGFVEKANEITGKLNCFNF